MFVEKLRIVFVEGKDRHRADDEIADDAITVRQLVKEEKADDGRKNHLGIVEDGNLFGRCMGIGCGDGKLGNGGRKAGAKQRTQLGHRHGVILKHQKRQGRQTGKTGKEKHNEGAPLTMFADFANEGIGNAGADAADQP